MEYTLPSFSVAVIPPLASQKLERRVNALSGRGVSPRLDDALVSVWASRCWLAKWGVVGRGMGCRIDLLV